MSRFSRYDTDEERLPEGMTRIGYDADDETYTFRDADGSIWESAPGCRYGQLTRVSSGTAASAGSEDGRRDSDSAGGDTHPFLLDMEPQTETSWRHDLRPLFNFGMLVCLCLLALFWYLNRSHSSSDGEPSLEICGANGQTSYRVKDGDSCWSIGEGAGISVDGLIRMNPSVDCDKLCVGSILCLPTV